METKQIDADALHGEIFEMNKQLVAMGEGAEVNAMAKDYAVKLVEDVNRGSCDTPYTPSKPKIGSLNLIIEYHRKVRNFFLGCHASSLVKDEADLTDVDLAA